MNLAILITLLISNCNEPTCSVCNGPGCEELDAVCDLVESGSIGLLCDDGATLAPNEFVTLDEYGRGVTCRCKTADCGAE